MCPLFSAARYGPVMAESDWQGRLFGEPTAPEGVVVVNDRCLVRTQDEHRVVIVSGVVLAQYVVGDRMAEAHAMVMLAEGGWADQNDVARAFGNSARTLRRHQRRFEDSGLAALGRAVGYPRGRARVAGRRLGTVRRLKQAGVPNREIARRLGVNEKAVRKLCRRIGWQEKLPEQPTLPLTEPHQAADPNVSAFLSTTGANTSAGVGVERSVSVKGEPTGADPNLSAFCQDDPLPISLDTDPTDRSMDRLMACLGLLDDAAPLFGSAKCVPHAGVLLAIPALLNSGAFAIARQVYGSIGPAFYGLRTTLVVLLLMALLRIKRAEALKEHSPTDLGRLLGLDRAPEVKTLRRKLSRLASLGRSAQFGRALAEHRVSVRSAALGFLYVDGHVRVYHGKHRLPKTHVARRRLAMPATSDYWVNDIEGDPLFVITAEANAHMTAMLLDILDEVRKLLGERRITVVFDRGGFSPRLFQQILARGFDILTYRKGRVRRLPKHRFKALSASIDGHQLNYVLADQEVRLLEDKLRLRQVTRLCEDGQHQTPILTSRRDLGAVEVAYRMFERWRQENFFKYLREEYAIDALVDYAVVADDAQREVPNPKRHKLDAEFKAARAELAELQARYGNRAFQNPESRHRTMRGFKVAESELARQMRLVEQRIRTLQHKRDRLPKRVPVGDVVHGEIVKLAPERKHLTSLLKMIAYQTESDLVRLISPYYKRAEDEARTLIQTALNSAADVEVTDTELRITLAALSSAHRTRAIAALCEELNRNPACFPGSRLRLRFAASDPG
jgi:transposase